MIKKYISINDMTEEDFTRAYDMIPTDRRRRLGRIRNEDDRRRSIAADMIMRSCVSELSGLSPRELTFARTEKGKPYSTDTDINFSVSHCGEYAVCVADKLPVGVDIERLRIVRLRIARRFCSQKELIYVFGEPVIPHDEDVPPEQIEEVCHRLLTIWTLKESHFKNIGVGIAANLKSVEFQVDNTEVKSNVDGYKFTLDYSIGGYVMSICETIK